MKERHWLTGNSTTSTFIAHQQSESKPCEAPPYPFADWDHLLPDVQHLRKQFFSILRFFIQNYNVFSIELVALLQSVVSYEGVCGCTPQNVILVHNDSRLQLSSRLSRNTHSSLYNKSYTLHSYVGCWKSFCIQYEKKHVKFGKWLYCFSKYSPLTSTHFCIRPNQFSKHFFHSKAVISVYEMFQQLLQATQIVHRASYF